MDDRISKQANLEQAMAALTDPLISKWMKERGFVRGDFDGQRNLADRIEDDQYREQLNEALRGSAQADRQGYEKLLKGFATLTGTEWTPELQERSRTLSSDFATVAPYLYKLAPDLFDDLHGETGSVASLTHAIAEANKGRMDPRQAQQTAETVFGQLYDGDPMKTRGFSARQMGQIYQQMARRGMIAPGAKPQDVARALERYSGPLSAVRDTLGHQGWPVGVGDMFHAMDRLAPGELSRYPAEELEQRLRVGDILGRQGGLFSASYKQTNPAAPAGKPSLPLAPSLASQDSQLRQQAATSPVGNMVAATMRLNSELPFETGTPAARLVEQIQQGEMPIKEPGEWLEMLEASGVDRNMAGTVLNQQSVNADFITPELVDTVRRNQMNIDVRPRLDQAANTYAGMIHPQAPRARAAIEGARDQAARGMGYDSLTHMQQLHGPAAQGTRGILQQAKQDAQHAQSVSHLGRGNFGRRMVSAVQDATPQTNWQELGTKAFNMIGKDKIPQPAQQRFPEVFNKQGGLSATFKEHKSYDPICPHCGEVMYEKHFWPDREQPNMWRHRGDCWDKGPFEITWPDQEERDATAREFSAWLGRTTDDGGGSTAKEAHDRVLRVRDDQHAAGNGRRTWARTSILPDPWIEAPRRLRLAELDDLEKLSAHVTTVAVDLDGTIAKPYEKFDPDVIEAPRPGAKEQLQKFKDLGYRVIIFTVRGKKKRIRDYLEEHELPYDYINENPDQPADASGKVMADLYIDDRAIDARKAWRRLGVEARRRLKAA